MELGHFDERFLDSKEAILSSLMTLLSYGSTVESKFKIYVTKIFKYIVDSCGAS